MLAPRIDHDLKPELHAVLVFHGGPSPIRIEDPPESSKQGPAGPSRWTRKRGARSSRSLRARVFKRAVSLLRISTSGTRDQFPPSSTFSLRGRPTPRLVPLPPPETHLGRAPERPGPSACSPLFQGLGLAWSERVSLPASRRTGRRPIKAHRPIRDDLDESIRPGPHVQHRLGSFGKIFLAAMPPNRPIAKGTQRIRSNRQRRPVRGTDRSQKPLGRPQ